MKVRIAEEEELIPIADVEKQDYDIAWYKARCPKCNVVFSMFTGHDSTHLICPNGHRL